MIRISSREQVAKKQALMTAEMLLETYTANLEAKGFMEPVHVTEFPIRNQLETSQPIVKLIINPVN